MDTSLSVRTKREPRQADRRLGLHALVRQVAEAAVGASGVSEISSALTSRLSRLAPVRSVQLTEVATSAELRADQPIFARDYAAFTVPLRPGGPRVMLEAAFDSGARPDAWTCQLLESAAALAAVVLESERAGLAVSALVTQARDEVAPLIGSSDVMQLLRDRVERVAATDFTILIEGPSDRYPHYERIAPDFRGSRVGEALNPIGR